MDGVIDDQDGNVDRGLDENSDGDEVRHEAKEMVQLWTDLTRERLEEALRERWNKDPGVYKRSY